MHGRFVFAARLQVTLPDGYVNTPDLFLSAQMLLLVISR